MKSLFSEKSFRSNTINSEDAFLFGKKNETKIEDLESIIDKDADTLSEQKEEIRKKIVSIV